MISLSFHNPQGLWLLLLVPVLWLLARWRCKVKDVPLAVFPVVEGALAVPPAPVPRWLRLTPRQKALLAACAALCGTFAASGPSLTIPRTEPGEWLAVVDNTYLLDAAVDGKGIRPAVAEGLAGFLGAVPSRDRVQVLVTSPHPRLLRVAPGQTASGLLAAVEASPRGPPPDELAQRLRELSADAGLRGRVVLSPRAEEWERALRGLGLGGEFQVAPATARNRGNAGITDFRLDPSSEEEGAYRLRFQVLARGLGRNSVPFALRSGGADLLEGEVRPDREGWAVFEAPRVHLEPGPVELLLVLEDSYPADDRVEAWVGGKGPLAIRLIGPAPAHLREAVAAHPGFAIVPASGGSARPAVVDVYAGAVPETPEAIARPTLVAGPVRSFLGFELLRLRKAPGEVEWHPLHPVTRHLTFRNLAPGRVLDFSVAAGQQVLARAGEAPVLVAGETGGHRLLVWNLDLTQAAVTLDPSFVVLVRESLEWLAGVADVKWGRLAGCGEEGGPSRSGEMEGEGGNLLCAQVTAQAASLSLPGPPTPEPPADLPRRAEALDFSLPAVLLALTLSFYGALVHIYQAAGA